MLCIVFQKRSDAWNVLSYHLYFVFKLWKETMTDMSKYKNVSLTKQTYATLDKLSKVLLPDAKLSISKTIESIANEKVKKLNGKVKKD